MSSNLRQVKPGGVLRVVNLAAVALLVTGCAQPDSSLDAIRARGQLHMVTVNSPTTYYLGAHGPQGFDYRLVSAFASSLGVPLVVNTVANAAAMRSALTHGRADIAAAQISPDGAWRDIGLTTVPYETIPELVVQPRGKPQMHSIEGLRNSRIVLGAGSPQQTLLEYLRIRQAPYLSWKTVRRDEADPLDLVNSGGADYAIVDANEFAFSQHLYPEVVVAFSLPIPRQVQWVVPENASELQQAASRFIESAQNSGELARIEAVARNESVDFDYESAHQFQADIAARLPALQSLFEEASQATGLDWRLLAAVGYQESKWQDAATSANGARGIMMLTNDAATTVGVDRDNLRQNILGGARYLAQVIDTIPKRIPDPDRTWLALAAYNVGYGHLEDARVLAQMHGKNPDSWSDVRTQLPLLAEEQWYMRAKRGYARGWEPAKFVEGVRQYLAVLEWIDADKTARSRVMTTRSAAIVGTEQPNRLLN
ncbi:MAG: membrane-bound lytic murein transglycosylase MltF [Steroidobacteraceae bacterium]